jgi:hypothetical protein
VIYPATYDISLLQNSTWKTQLRVTENKKEVTSVQVTASGVPTFVAACHGLSATNKVVFTGSSTCGLDENVVYYVIASDLTSSTFKVSSTISGSSVTISGSFPSALYVATPIDITGYTIDADIKDTDTLVQVATFTTSLITPTEGLAELSISPATTLALDPDVYAYDVSLTSPGGERYYWLSGNATVVRTYSRN